MRTLQITEILIEARRQELARVDVRRAELLATMAGRGGVRRVVAAALVRFAAHLDREVLPSARELERRTG